VNLTGRKTHRIIDTRTAETPARCGKVQPSFFTLRKIARKTVRQASNYVGQKSGSEVCGHCPHFSLSKKIFDRLVDGGASSPATTTPTRFYLKPTASGRKICKETIFLPGNGISLQKNRCGRAVHAAATDLILRSIEFF